MKYFSKNRRSLKSGQAVLMVVIMCTAIFLTIVLGVVEPMVNELRLSSDLLRSKSSLFTAESGIDDAVYRVKRSMISDYAAPISININNYFATTTINNSGGTKTITTTGSDNKNVRKVETKIVTGTGVDFFYGVQSGNGGMQLSGGTIVYGNIFSNGSVESTNGATVTGSVIAANPSSTTTAIVGGGNSSSGLEVGSAGVGDVWAHRVTGTQIAGSLYCQTSANTNKSCDTSREDPAQQPMPITDADIAAWKSEASASSTFVGNKTVGGAGATLGPMKITGDLTVNGGGTLTLAGTVWVQGNISFTGGGKLKLATGFGFSGGVLLADGTISLAGNSEFAGSGEEGSYPMIITTNSGTNAMSVNGGTGAVVLVAQNGTLNFSGGNQAKSLVANRIVLTGGSTIIYDAGLANYNFVSGPSGGWNITSWKEVQ